MPIEKTYECEVVTPMFLGGVDPTKVELRAPSVKGALRYWWRALHGNLNIKELHRKEAEIFGSSHTDYQLKSKISVRTKTIKLKKDCKPFKSDNLNTIKYMSFGKWETGNNGEFHEYFDVGGKFEIIIKYDDQLTKEQIDSVEQALALVFMVGGLGSKSRNGFGRFSITNLNYSIDNVFDWIGERKEYPPADFTAFSEKTEIFWLDDNNSSIDALVSLGNSYKDIRKFLNTSERSYIGSPFKNSAFNIERHGKPLFLSVIKNQDNTYSGCIFLIPYNYCSGYEVKGISKEDLLKNYNEAIKRIINYIESAEGEEE
ncbi:type III-B CRISPR module RAMP protein Cmr1 [Melioribacter sp. OK-6-Me]|uniref:type III-B CRISPR module RAMP protein Cmr1 n=1 Tax=unclassified Melioribacter TaxID=2627329 RepID=UPI003ED8AFA6